MKLKATMQCLSPFRERDEISTHSPASGSASPSKSPFSSFSPPPSSPPKTSTPRPYGSSTDNQRKECNSYFGENDQHHAEQVRSQQFQEPDYPCPASPPRVTRQRSNATTPVSSTSICEFYSIIGIHSPRTLKQLQFESPRLQYDDAQLFPTTRSFVAKLKQPEDRWKCISDQAGSHRQEGTVLHISRQNITPVALKAGIPPERAKLVKELHLHFMDDHTALPEWLDVVANTFFNLEHLYLGGITKEDPNNKNNEENYCQEDTLSASSRLRRLYVLYRLPELKSVDGVPVTSNEQNLARPADPKGHRVRRDDWITAKISSSLLDQEGECMDDADSDEYSSSPTARSVVDISISTNENTIESTLKPIANFTLSSPQPGATAACSRTRILGRLAIDEENKDDPCCSSSRQTPERTCSGGRQGPVMEVASPSSSGACEWSAACGSLSLQYFRDSAKHPGRARPLFRRRFDKRQQTENHACFKVSGHENDKPLRTVQSFQPIVSKPRTPTNSTEKEVLHHTTVTKDAALSNIKPKSSEAPVFRQYDRTDDQQPKIKLKIFGAQKVDTIARSSLLPDQVKPSLVQNHSSIPSNSNTVIQNVRIPARKSLTSPFPMQFRVRDDDQPTLEKLPRRASLSPPPSSPNRSHTRWNSVGEMETIEGPLPLARVMSSPTELMQSTEKQIAAKVDRPTHLPPPRPPGSRRVTMPSVLSHTGAMSKNRRRLLKWRKQSVYATSILDVSADSDEDDDDDESFSDGEEEEDDIMQT